MRFSEACWAAGLSRPPPGSSPPSGVEVPEAYLVLLEGALTRQATGELLASALQVGGGGGWGLQAWVLRCQAVSTSP